MADFARVREHLEARGFTVSCFATAAEACDYLDRTLDGKSIGIGGSVTIRDMALPSGWGRITGSSGIGPAGLLRRRLRPRSTSPLSTVWPRPARSSISTAPATGWPPASTATKRSISSWGGTSWPPITMRPSGGPGILPGPKMPSASRKNARAVKGDQVL